MIPAIAPTELLLSPPLRPLGNGRLSLLFSLSEIPTNQELKV
jgi:hypothetical protein